MDITYNVVWQYGNTLCGLCCCDTLFSNNCVVVIHCVAIDCVCSVFLLVVLYCAIIAYYYYYFLGYFCMYHVMMGKCLTNQRLSRYAS